MLGFPCAVKIGIQDRILAENLQLEYWKPEAYLRLPTYSESQPREVSFLLLTLPLPSLSNILNFPFSSSPRWVCLFESFIDWCDLAGNSRKWMIMRKIFLKCRVMIHIGGKSSYPPVSAEQYWVFLHETQPSPSLLSLVLMGTSANKQKTLFQAVYFSIMTGNMTNKLLQHNFSMALHTKCINTGSPGTSDPLPACLERLLVLLNFDNVKLCKGFFIGSSSVVAQRCEHISRSTWFKN